MVFFVRWGFLAARFRTTTGASESESEEVCSGTLFFGTGLNAGSRAASTNFRAYTCLFFAYDFVSVLCVRSVLCREPRLKFAQVPPEV